MAFRGKDKQKYLLKDEKSSKQRPETKKALCLKTIYSLISRWRRGLNSMAGNVDLVKYVKVNSNLQKII